MNLYIFNESGRAAVYGIGTYIRELTTALKNSSINICVVHLRSDKPDMEQEESDGIHHWHIPAPINHYTSLDGNRQKELYYRNVVYLLQLHIKTKNQLIFHINYNQSGKLAEELKKAFDCKIVCGIHYLNWCFSLMGNIKKFHYLLEQKDTDSNYSSELKSYEDEKTLFGIVDKIISLSHHTAEILKQDYLLPTHKINVIYNGLTNNNQQPDKASLKKKYHIAPQYKVILFAGRLDKIKGLEYLIPSFRVVLKQHPKSKLIIIGNGTFEQNLKLCEDIWSHVIFTGLIDKTKLYEFYSLADLGVMPSFHEQCSYVAIEMMMHGLPIIASTTTGLKEMIEDGVSGMHVPITEYPDRVELDIEILAEKMLYLLENKEEAKRIGQNARKRYEEKYSAEVFGRNMQHFYATI